MLKKITNLLMLAILLMETMGCSRVVSREEKALELLNRKYKDEFVIQEVQSRSITRGFYTVIAYPKDQPGLLFRADVDSGGDSIGDTYVSRVLCNKLAKQAAANLDQLPGTYYIHVVVSLSPYFLDNPEITLEEFMKESPKNKFTFHVHYAHENMEAELFYQELTTMFEGMELVNGKVHLYLADEIQIAQVQEYIENHDRCYDDFTTLTEHYSVGIYDVEQGKVVTPKEEVMESLEAWLLDLDMSLRNE